MEKENHAPETHLLYSLLLCLEIKSTIWLSAKTLPLLFLKMENKAQLCIFAEINLHKNQPEECKTDFYFKKSIILRLFNYFLN